CTVLVPNPSWSSIRVADEQTSTSAHNTTDSACWCHRDSPSSSVAAARGWLAVVGPKMARIPSSFPAIASSRVAPAKGCIVTVIRSMIRTFRGHGMCPRRGGGRVVAHARSRLGGQVIGTGIRHDFQASAVVGVARRVVETTFSAPLMARFRLTHRVSLTAFAAVDLAVVIRLAEVDALRAARTTNPHKNIDIQAPTATAALMEVAPPERPRAPSPCQRPRATRRLRAPNPGPSSFAAVTIAYAMS